MFEYLSRPPKESPVGTYRVEVISLPEECEWDEYLPVEIRYVFKFYPQYKEKIRNILASGKAIGIRTVLRTPENILKAVHTISVHSQQNYIITWLPQLLSESREPIFTAQDLEGASSHGEDLNAAVETIAKDRLRFKRLVLIDEENIGISDDEQALMKELSDIIYPLAVDYSIFRVIADNARERTEVARTIIKMLLVVGPVAHVLERFAAGIGKVFAASADDLLGESAELMALRGSGFTWGELARRSRILIPVFILATWGAFSVEGLIEKGDLVLAGVVFGLSAVALSFTTAVQSVGMYKNNIDKLAKEGKVDIMDNWSRTKIAIAQDFTNPARFGLLLGVSMAPIMGIIGALSGLMHNGWVLAAIGSTESIVAGLTVVCADSINNWRFHKKLRNLLKNKKASS